MASKFVALAEEATWRTVGDSWMFFKILRESINTTREDFFPETTEYWTVDSKAEGYFRTAGDFDVLIDPVQFPKLLVLFISDGTSTAFDTSMYRHTFLFGVDETVAATGIKPFSLKVGTGIEKDRQILGNVINSLSFEAVNREVASCTVGIIGSGDESLVAAANPVYTAYTQPYLTFASAATMQVGGTDRLTTAPTIEAFRLTLTRGWDADHYVLGRRFLSAPSLSGMASVEGSMDFSFTSQDEHERFLAAVGTYQAGDQASFTIQLNLDGAVVGAYVYRVQFLIPEAYYTASTCSVDSRNRIVQTCNFRGNYNAGETCACRIAVQNITTSYTTLA